MARWWLYSFLAVNCGVKFLEQDMSSCKGQWPERM